MFRLRTLGVLDLVNPEGTTLHSVLAQPKRLGLLVYLCVEGAHEYHSREALLPLFWPESDEATARHSLSQVLYKLRQSLGTEVVETRGKEELRVPRSFIECDVLQFRECVADGKAAAALELYRGDFLGGLAVPGAAEFERWQERERAQLRRLAAEASWSLAHQQLGRSAVREAEASAARAIGLDSASEATARAFIKELAEAGHAAVGISLFKTLEAAMVEDLAVAPGPETLALVENVRAPPPGGGGGAAPAGGEAEDRGHGTPDGGGASRASSTPAVSITVPLFQPPPNVGRRKELLTGFGAAILIVGGVLLAGLGLGSQPPPGADVVAVTPDKVRRVDLVLSDSAPLAFVGAAPLGIGRPALAISPTGDHIAYVAREDTSTRLYVRPLDQRDPIPLAGTEAAFGPFFSPDGEWIGFFAGRYLRKVAVGGGRPITLGTIAEPFGAAWGGDGRILVADRQGMRLVWFPAEGGAPEPQDPPLNFRVTEPHLLHGGEWILHGARDGALSRSSLKTGRRYALTSRGWIPREEAEPGDLLYGTNPHLLRSGHLAYVSGDGVLQAIRVGSDGGPPTEPVSLLEGIRVEGEHGAAQFDVSLDGTLVYAPGDNMRYSRFVRAWHGTGARDTLPFPTDKYAAFDLAPDGGRILVVIHCDAGPAELWVLDRRSGTRSRIPTEGIVTPFPRWGSDGQAVIYGEYGPSGTIRDGVTVRQTLTSAVGPDTLAFGSWFLEPSPGDRLLATSRDDEIILFDTQKNGDISLERGAYAFLEFSPNGEWLAYTDYVTGDQSEVYLSPVDTPDVRHRVTLAGGEEAVWTPDGDFLVYRNGDRWERVEVSTEGEVRISSPEVVLQGPYLQVPGWSSDIFPDGRSQLLLVNSSESVTRNLVLVLNWDQELESLRKDGRR